MYIITDSPSYFDFLQADLDAHPKTKAIFLKITDRTIGLLLSFVVAGLT